MLGIDRNAARSTWTVALVVALLVLVYLARTTLFVFVLAVLFAYLLSPLVNLLDRFLPTRARGAALALSYVIFVGVVGFGGFQIGSRVAYQAKSLSRNLPAQVEQWKNQPADSSTPGVVSRYKVRILDELQAEISKRSSDMFASAAEAGLRILTVASGLVYLVIIPVLGFFFLKDGRAIREHILSLVEEGPRRGLLDDVMVDLDALLARYMRALMLLSLAAFTAYSVFFSIVGIPYGILLALLAALLEIIPTLGPLTASVTIVLIAAISGSHIIAVIIFLVAFRMFQDYFLSPLLMGRGVELHPLMVLFGVFAGAEVAGVAGAFLSVPALALVRILYLRVQKAHARVPVNPPDRVFQ
ncbi:MAG: AI-2E family transporter [Bryobacteraceae bacterium]|jgi:predicted PurR-regulated permease PerM